MTLRLPVHALCAVALAAAMTVSGGTAAAQDQGQGLGQDKGQDQAARKGMIFAYRWCSTCHLDPAHAAPPFQAMADGGALSLEYLRENLKNPRHGMIPFDVTEEEIGNLYEYFRSLRK